MKLYSFYTPSHEIFKDEWFLKTIKDNYDIVMRRCEQKGSGRYHEKGWGETMLFREDMIITAIRENWGGVFVYSDVDVQFFDKTEPALLKAICNNDIVLQRDDPVDNVCLGFFIARANRKVLKLWELLRKQVIAIGHDQLLANEILRHYNLTRIMKLKKLGGMRRLSGLIKRVLRNSIVDCKYDLLPLEFYGGGTLTGKTWNPEINLPLPSNIILHHANWTVGIENKVVQLQYVKDTVTRNQGLL